MTFCFHGDLCRNVTDKRIIIIVDKGVDCVYEDVGLGLSSVPSTRPRENQVDMALNISYDLPTKEFPRRMTYENVDK